jgi:peroxiredoxin
VCNRLPILISLSALFVVACAPTGTIPAVDKRQEGLPSTPLVTLEGAATDLPTVLHGRVAVLSLWATWCDACVDEIAALERLDAQAHSRDDALVVGIAVGEPRETVAAFALHHRLPHEQLVDERFQLADALGQQRVPATLVVDHAGRIVYRGGALDPAGLAAFRTALQAQ